MSNPPNPFRELGWTDPDPTPGSLQQLGDLPRGIRQYGQARGQVVEDLVGTHPVAKEWNVGKYMQTDVRSCEQGWDIDLRNRVKESHVRERAPPGLSD